MLSKKEKLESHVQKLQVIINEILRDPSTLKGSEMLLSSQNFLIQADVFCQKSNPEYIKQVLEFQKY